MAVRKTLKRSNKRSINRSRSRRRKRSQRKMRSKKVKKSKGGFISLKQMIRSGSTQSFMPNKK